MFAERDVQIQERLLAVSNGFSRQRSVGYQLDDLYTLLGIYRADATQSTVTATLAGAAGTVIQAGTRAATRSGALFRLRADATIGAGFTVSALMEAVDTGPVTAAAGELDRIVDLVPGWETVTNASDATPGQDREPTPTFRARASRETDTNALGAHEAILSAVYAAGASDVVVSANPTDTDLTLRGATIFAKGVLVIAAGGANADVASAIIGVVAAGIATGIGGVTVATDYGDVQFSRPTDVAATVAVSIAIEVSTFPGDGIGRIRDSVAAYVNALKIGQQADANRVTIAVYQAIPEGGLVVSATPTVEDSGGNDLTLEAGVGLTDRIRADAASITVTVV